MTINVFAAVESTDWNWLVNETLSCATAAPRWITRARLSAGSICSCQTWPRSIAFARARAAIHTRLSRAFCAFLGKETEIFKEKAYKIGEENFDYKTIATKIYNFLFN
jgi:hypothetical protein